MHRVNCLHFCMHGATSYTPHHAWSKRVQFRMHGVVTPWRCTGAQRKGHRRLHRHTMAPPSDFSCSATVPAAETVSPQTRRGMRAGGRSRPRMRAQVSSSRTLLGRHSRRSNLDLPGGSDRRPTPRTMKAPQTTTGERSVPSSPASSTTLSASSYKGPLVAVRNCH